MEGVTTVQLLVLATSGATGVLTTLLRKRIDGIARDVATIREKVDDHAERLAAGAAKIEALEKQVNGLLERERAWYRSVRVGAADGL